MKFTVTYKVNGVQFSATCDTVAEAYECVKAIVKRESAAFPRAEETLSGYIELLAKMATGSTFSHENHYFKIFKVEKPE